jgi:hypothetical protein
VRRGASSRQPPERSGRDSNLCQKPRGIRLFANTEAQNAAHSLAISTLDPDLETLTDAWPDLPPAIKRAVMALVRVASDRDEE